MEVFGMCRCCLAQGASKELNVPYVWLNKSEIYSDMLRECFNLVITSSTYLSNMICEACIKMLRDSLGFKQQVMRTEQELAKTLSNLVSEDEKPFQIKLEPKQDTDDDSDDYFLADAVRVSETSIKEEPTKKKNESEKSKKKSVQKLPNTSRRANKIKTLVTRLATSINSCDMPDLNISKKEVKITVKPRKKIDLLWTSSSNVKEKHKENLQTILKFSNATPFKNKSLLGFMCGYCETSFPDPADLRMHTEVDHKKDRLNFKTNFDMTEFNVKLDVTDLTCTLCDEKMQDLTIFKDHLVKIHDKVFYKDIKDHILQFRLKKGDVFDCALCTSTYETFKMLKQHMNKHYGNYTCSKCGSAFTTKRSLNAHRGTHQEGSFKCEYCEKIFASRTKKLYHEKMKHLGARNISNCPYCNEPFRSYYQRNQHLVKVHNSEAPYKCNICDKAYILKSLLMYHIKKNHLMERNYQCTECGYRFFSKKALKAHMVKHTGERKYSCEVCNKSYARKYTLREHMRIHNNDRRFKCDVCGFTFVQKCSLKNHLLSNHGISMAAADITTSV